MVGVTGFEPATSWSQTRRTTKLCYTPNRAALSRVANGRLFSLIACGLQGGSLRFLPVFN